MSYSVDIKEKAISLRKSGHSIKEISKILSISIGTSSLWLSNIILNKTAQNRLKSRKILGQYKAIQTNKRKRVEIHKHFETNAIKDLSTINWSVQQSKLLCSIFYWTEGGKFTDSYMNFINSDPKMVKTFLILLRKSFELDETKFRALIHIHEYHNKEEINKFWAEITDIPLQRFLKSYLKPNTKKRIKNGYMGTISIRYYDYKIALELRALYNVLAKNLGV